MNHGVGPALDGLVAAQVDRLATLVGTVEDRVVQQTTLVVYLHERGIGRNGTVAFLDHLVLHTAGQRLHTVLLGVGSKELLTSLLVRTVGLLHLTGLDSLHQCLSHILGRVNCHQGSLTCGTGHKTSHEVLHRDGLGGIIPKHLVVDTLDHTGRDLLTNLDTGIVGGLLLVVASVGTLVQTLDELTHIGCVNTQTTYKVFLQTLSLCQTNGITHGINIALQACLRSRIATTGKCCGCNSHNGYKH